MEATHRCWSKVRHEGFLGKREKGKVSTAISYICNPKSNLVLVLLTGKEISGQLLMLLKVLFGLSSEITVLTVPSSLRCGVSL